MSDTENDAPDPEGKVEIKKEIDPAKRERVEELVRTVLEHLRAGNNVLIITSSQLPSIDPKKDN